EWGRDAMIALRGFHHMPQFRNIGRLIIERFLEHRGGGLMPNYFPEEGGDPEYNTVDATLWLFETFFRYWRIEELHKEHKVSPGAFGKPWNWIFGKPLRGVHPHWAALKEMIEQFERGTSHGIELDSDGL